MHERCLTSIERLFIPGPEGRLEAMLERRPDADPRHVAIVCHPHPRYGGTMHNKVVFRAAKAAILERFLTLRFNFRGVGKSAGTFADGLGEQDDLRAALNYLWARFAAGRACLMGFSFGAEIAMAVGAENVRACALVGMGVPVSTFNFDFLRAVTKPKFFIQGTLDQYGPRRAVQALYESLPAPKQIRWIEGADHFFTGHLDEVQSHLRSFLSELPRT